MKKTSETFGSYALKFLPLHPLLKTKAARVVHSSFKKRWTGGFSSFFFLSSLSTRETTRKEKREKIKKTYRKIFGRYALKFLPLHPLSEKNSNRETSDL